MRWIQTLTLRLRSLIRSTRVERELDDELRFHLEEQIARDVAAGATPADARAAALRAFGGVDQIKEACRDERHVGLVDHVVRDVRYAARALTREPGFSLVAIATIALGIGVSTAMFAVVHSVLLKPLPFADPDRLVMVYTVSNRGPFKFRDGNFTDAGYFGVRNSRSFAQLAAFNTSVSALTGAGEPAWIPHAEITADLLPLLGVRPAIGRGFLTGEDTAGRAHVALLSDRLWRSHFATDPGVLGRTINLDGEAYTVIGVMPPGVGFPGTAHALNSPDVLTPAVLDPAYTANTRRHIIGRLAPGATGARAEAELLTIAQHAFGDERPDGAGIRVVGLKESLVGDVRPLLLIFLGAVGLVLLIACANVGNLLLARGAGRGKELALRAALGASRARLVQQLLTESTVLVAAGGVAGLLVARAGVALLLQLVPANKLPRIAEIGMDADVFVFAALLCLITALVIGALPAVVGASKEVNEPLQEGAGRSTARGVTRLRSALVVAEVALVLVLLAGAGLLAKSLWLLQRVDPGFRPEDVLTIQIALPESVYRTVGQRQAFDEQVLTRMRGLPNGADASLVNLLPFGDMGWRGDFEVEGGTVPGDLLVGKPAVGGRYFKALGISLRRGRLFDDGDADGAPRVAIVSAIVAQRCWPGADPIGRRLRMDSSRPDGWLTVVGVVADVRQASLAAQPQPMIYVPYQQEWRGFFLANMAFLVRLTGNPDVVADGMRGAVHAVDRDLPVTNVAMLDALLSRSIVEPRFRASLLVAFAGMALVLACVGISGLVAYDVTRRTREIGIRLALGAQPGDVVAMIMRRSLTLVAAGVVVGVPSSLALARLLTTFLYGVTPGDPATLVAVAVAIVAAAVAAAFVPARRATRIQPVIALRYE